MTRDDTIRMAREAGLVDYCDLEGDSVGLLALVTLCQDVAAAEREACAKLCEEPGWNAANWDSSYWDQACENRAAAIRARGQE